MSVPSARFAGVLKETGLFLAVGALLAPAALGDPDPPEPPTPVPSVGAYGWPVEGPVIRRFEPPTGPYGAGHRGIDIAAESGRNVNASADGVVAFAGKVAGELHVSIDHPDGIRTSYSYLSSVDVRRGQPVARGEVIGGTAGGHPGVTPQHLHFGARLAGQYIDPMLLLERGSLVGLIHLAPIEEGDSPHVP
jgi:murein DD-endopeptidase MepM/ murein hydrolase activator NlpD